ncbi:hypothetical protein SAMN05444266_104211 [Chitinophaga jiangningensis]|uniref:SnoaL-like domain-containing protein n=1 Tax=Chitinophaga jiangningensis TaxID=1419482 RepID=A0A1M7C6C9_9BACT|nr:hypothetical protein [Chitinophaga jiangningensis]SHL62781.1 hypothetical protein SAMN05444266_104211 [Chitinophaga jiangningensis]
MITTLEKLFTDYGKAAAGHQPQAIAHFYAKEFMVADGGKSKPYKNDESFIEWLRSVIDYNKKTGLLRMEVIEISLNNITDHYTSAKVTWGATYQQQPDTAIPFNVTYLLEVNHQQPLILMYINHQNQEELMKANHII